MNRARLAGCVYFLVFATGGLALAGRGAASSAAGAIAGVLYIAVTLLFYGLFKPVSQRVSAIAAVVSLAGIAAGPLLKVNPLPIFGVYCLLIGWLILKSTFVPRILGGLMVFAGLGWLTFLSPSLAHALFPWNYAPGLIGEGSLTVWLLWKGRATFA
jgi:hypothetical protein